MSCTSKISSAAITLPVAAPVRWHRPAFLAAIVTIAEVFREAMVMRRAMNRTHDLNDE
jgi:hypothetical protein